MDKDQLLKSEVLKRVRTVFYMRTVVRPLLIEMALFIGSITAISLLVSIPNVLINLSHSPDSSYYLSYLLSAFIHTRVVVQIVLLVATVLFVLLIKDILKNIKYLRKVDFA